MRRTGAIIAILIAVGGCTPAAMTPGEYREQVRRSYPQQHESYVVNRSSGQVVDSFRRKAKECLNFDVKGVSRGLNYGDTWTVTSNKAYVKQSGGNYALIMQTVMQSNISKGPADGYYVMVVDATPAGSNKTKIDAYISLSNVYKDAVRQWANGNERGCPDGLRMWTNEKRN